MQTNISGRIGGALPLIEMQQLFEWQARQPARGFQFGAFVEVADIADAKISHRNNVSGQVECGAQGRLVENADPADPQIFGACCAAWPNPAR